MNNKNRISYIDKAKALAIILVVVGHSTTSKYLVNFIYLFHMPLFIFLSGYFYKDEYTNNIFSFIKKKIHSIYIPFIKYEIILILLHNVFLDLQIYDSNIIPYYNKSNYIRNIVHVLTFRQTEQMAFPFWFLTSLFTIHLVFSLISYTSNLFKKHSELVRFFLVGIIFILGNITVTQKILFDWSLNTSMITLLFYYIGYLYNKYEHKINFNFKYTIIPIICMIISSNWRIDISTNIYINPLFFIVNSLCGIYVIVYISKKLCRFSSPFIDYIGSKTIVIMAFQFLGFYIGNNVIAEYGLDVRRGYWILISSCGVIIPLLIDYLLKQININSSTLSKVKTI